MSAILRTTDRRLFDLESELRETHKDGVKNLRLTAESGEIGIEGEARSYYDKQLLLEHLRSYTDQRISGARLIVRTNMYLNEHLSKMKPYSEAESKPQPLFVSPIKYRVLVASSDHNWLGKCVRQLEKVGCKVSAARTGIECLEEIRKDIPDILVVHDRLNWGGATGVLAAAADKGYFNRLRALYCGIPETSLDEVTEMPHLPAEIYLTRCEGIEQISEFVQFVSIGYFDGATCPHEISRVEHAFFYPPQ